MPGSTALIRTFGPCVAARHFIKWRPEVPSEAKKYKEDFSCTNQQPWSPNMPWCFRSAICPTRCQLNRNLNSPWSYCNRGSNQEDTALGIGIESWHSLTEKVHVTLHVDGPALGIRVSFWKQTWAYHSTLSQSSSESALRSPKSLNLVHPYDHGNKHCNFPRFREQNTSGHWAHNVLPHWRR